MPTSPWKNHDFEAHWAFPSPEDERRLLHRIAAGETEAFWELWMPYYPLFARLCLRWMHNDADAEDALSGASLRGAQQIPAYAHQITNVKAWLTRLLYNYCMHMYRTKQVSGSDVASTFPAAAAGQAATAWSQKHPEDALLDGEMRLHIRWAITQLPGCLQEPMWLYFFYDMPQRDIAIYLCLAPAAVRKRLERGRTILRKKLTPYLIDGPALPRHRAFVSALATRPSEAQRQ